MFGARPMWARLGMLLMAAVALAALVAAADRFLQTRGDSEPSAERPPSQPEPPVSQTATPAGKLVATPPPPTPYSPEAVARLNGRRNPAQFPPCRAEDLEARAGFSPWNMGHSFAGSVRLTNRSDHPCTFGWEELPATRLRDEHGGALAVDALPAPPCEQSGLRRCSLVSLFVVFPGEWTYLQIFWSNWCGPGRGTVDILVTFADERGALVAPLSERGAAPIRAPVGPRCADPGRPSWLVVLPFDGAVSGGQD